VKKQQILKESQLCKTNFPIQSRAAHSCKSNKYCKQHHCAKQAFRYKAEQYNRVRPPSSTIMQKQQILQAAQSYKTSFPIQSIATPSCKIDAYCKQHNNVKQAFRYKAEQHNHERTPSSTNIQKEHILHASQSCIKLFDTKQSSTIVQEHQTIQLCKNKLSDTKQSSTTVQ